MSATVIARRAGKPTVRYNTRIIATSCLPGIFERHATLMTICISTRHESISRGIAYR